MELVRKLMGKSGKKWDRPKVVLAAMLLVIFALTIARIFIMEELDTDNFVYADQLKEIRDLDLENQEIRTKLLKEESLTVIATKAAGMGFVPVKSYLYFRTIYGGR